MKPAVDAEEDLGSIERRYRTLFAQKLAIGDVGNPSNVDRLIVGTAAGFKIARGQLTTVTATDTVVTGLATVVSVVASLDADPVDDPFMCTATIGDQAGAPAAGSVIIKTWKNTGGTD